MEAPRLPSLFKARRSKQFDYKPFYYDEAKEERLNRNRQIIAALESEKLSEQAPYRTKLRERWERSNSAQKQNNRSNVRLIVILIALVLISYYFLQ